MEVTFSVFEREDGGRVAELSVAGERALERVIEPVDLDDFDPTLRWYVDVVWDEENPPKTQAEAARWYAPRRAGLRAALEELADKLEVGIDMDPVPLVHRFASPGGPSLARVSAQRRVPPGRIAASLREAMAQDIVAVEPLAAWPAA